MKKTIILILTAFISILLYSQDKVVLKNSGYEGENFTLNGVKIMAIKNDTVIYKTNSGKININELNDVYGIELNYINSGENTDFNVYKITKDSLFFTNGAQLHKDFILNKSFNNNFIDYYYDNINKANKIELGYLMNSLENYRSQNNTGRWLMFLGYNIGFIGGMSLNIPVAVIGGIVGTVGYVVNWNSLKHIKNNGAIKPIGNDEYEIEINEF